MPRRLSEKRVDSTRIAQNTGGAVAGATTMRATSANEQHPRQQRRFTSVPDSPRRRRRTCRAEAGSARRRRRSPPAPRSAGAEQHDAGWMDGAQAQVEPAPAENITDIVTVLEHENADGYKDCALCPNSDRFVERLGASC